MLVEVNLRSRRIVFASDRPAAMEIREAHVSGQIELMNTADSDASDGLAAFNKLSLPDGGTANGVGQAAGNGK